MLRTLAFCVAAVKGSWHWHANIALQNGPVSPLGAGATRPGPSRRPAFRRGAGGARSFRHGLYGVAGLCVRVFSSIFAAIPLAESGWFFQSESVVTTEFVHGREDLQHSQFLFGSIGEHVLAIFNFTILQVAGMF